MANRLNLVVQVEVEIFLAVEVDQVILPQQTRLKEMMEVLITLLTIPVKVVLVVAVQQLLEVQIQTTTEGVVELAQHLVLQVLLLQELVVAAVLLIILAVLEVLEVEALEKVVLLKVPLM